jgi:hypothetical protein
MISESSLTESDFEFINFIRSYIEYNKNKQNNIITLSYNQLCTLIRKNLKYELAPKTIQKYLQILENIDFIVCIAKPFKNRRKLCIGKAKSVYVVSDSDENKIYFNASEIAKETRKLMLTDRQISGKLGAVDFVRFFKFFYDKTPLLFHDITTWLKCIKESDMHLIKIKNKHDSNIIVYYKSFLDAYKNIFDFIYKSRNLYAESMLCFT